MALITTNLGEVELLNKMLKAALVSDENYILRLFKNNYEPDAESETADFVEADYSSYQAKTLTRSGWNEASTASGKATAEYSAAQTFTCGVTGNTIYGYYLSGAASNVVLWAQRFGTARTLANGDSLRVTPKISVDSAE